MKNKSIQKAMNIDIENNNKFEDRNKINKTQWRTIYKFIEEDYFEESDIFQMIL